MLSKVGGDFSQTAGIAIYNKTGDKHTAGCVYRNLRICTQPAVYKFVNFYTHGPSSKFPTFCHKNIIRHCRPIKGQLVAKTEVAYRTVESHLFAAYDRYANANGEPSAMRLLSDCAHFTAFYRRG